MLVPSKRLFYALEAVLFLAYNTRSGAISSRALAEQQQLPTRYLEPIMQKLVRGGLLKSVRGPQGGYVLARDSKQISLQDVCALLDGDDAITPPSTMLGRSILQPRLDQASRQWNAVLDSISMAQLCEEATEKHIPTAIEPMHDFTI